MATGEAIHVSAIAAAPALKRGERHPALSDVHRFLELYGYLPAGARESDSLDAVLSDALARYQEFNSVAVTGELDVQTRDAMTRPRCGVKDLENGIAFALLTPQSHLDLSFAFGAGTEDTEGTGEFDGVRRAFCTWAATGNFAFREIGSLNEANFRISWVSPGDPDYDISSSSHIAHADGPNKEGNQQHIHFNDSFQFRPIASFPYSVGTETVALHEIGHLIGLNHSAVGAAVMTPGYPLEGNRTALHADDLAALDALYGPGSGRLASTVIFDTRQHFGNEASFLTGNFVGDVHDYSFACPRLDRTRPAYLLFEARHVSTDTDLLLINGQRLQGGVPRTSGDGYAGQVVFVPPALLTPSGNVLRIEARNEEGGTTHDIDDFIVDNMVVLYDTIVAGCVSGLQQRGNGSA